MAIAFDAVATGTTSSGTSTTWSHTIGGGANRILVVGVNNFNAVGGGAVTGVTYNGVAMSKSVGASAVPSATIRAELWYLLEASLPAAGAHNVTVNYSGTLTTAACGSISLTGASQTAPEATGTNSVDVSAPTYSGSVTTLTNNAFVLNTVVAGGAITVTPTSGGTERYDLSVASTVAGSGNTFLQVSAGLKSMTGTFSVNAAGYAHALISVAPSGVSASPGNAPFFGANF